jgi:hypothetical protein
MSFARGKNYQPPEIKQMWAGGPSRYWSTTKSGVTPVYYETGGYVGNYACQACNQPVVGVYRVGMGKNAGKWLCAGCADRSAKAENEDVAVEDVDVDVDVDAPAVA